MNKVLIKGYFSVNLASVFFRCIVRYRLVKAYTGDFDDTVCFPELDVADTAMCAYVSDELANGGTRREFISIVSIYWLEVYVCLIAIDT